MKKIVLLFALLATSCQIYAQTQAPSHYIHSIYFGGGSYYIAPHQVQELHEFLDAIPGVENFQITVHSHTDNIGGVEYNAWLSKMRSENSIRQLVLKNILESNISIEDFGELNPVYDNATLEGRLKNRRVDIILKPIVM